MNKNPVVKLNSMLLWGCVILVFFVCMVLFVLGFWVSMMSGMSREKGSCYECGFEPIRTARSSFSLRFFLLGVMFVVFDVEVVMMVPVFFGLSFGSSLISVLCLLSFILILAVGCLYERRDGSMDWVSEL
nr:NADH dehydrogenase subunit 3 [Modiolus nipponicus]QDO71925.1 NADH dehydrogenase subunit 3 [Modiolus nipponicus]